MTIGAILIVLGSIVNGVTVYADNWHSATSQLQGGRFLLGFGVSSEYHVL